MSPTAVVPDPSTLVEMLRRRVEVDPGRVAVPVCSPDPQALGRCLPSLMAVANDARPKVILTVMEVASCGASDEDHRLEIVDPETRRPLAEGRVGEIWFSGATGTSPRPRPGPSRVASPARTRAFDT